MNALAGAKVAAENLKKLRMNNGPVKDPLKELNIRSTPSTDKRTTSSFSKSAKVRNFTYHCCFVQDFNYVAIDTLDMLKYLNWDLMFSLEKIPPGVVLSLFDFFLQVFAELDKAQEKGNKAAKSDNADKPALNASSLKL
jgi:hypothetical protein